MKPEKHPRVPLFQNPWFMVAALSIASMVSYIDRQILTLLFTPIKADLHLTDTQVSLLAGLAFVLLYATVGLLMGWLADRWTRKYIIAWGILFWSAATFACGAAQNFIQLFLARMGVGVGESTLSPSAMSLISDSFTRDGLTRGMSVYVASSFVGMGLALVLGAAGIQAAMALPPMSVPGLGEVKPWQMAFFIVGAVGSLAVIPVLLATEPPRSGGAGPKHAAAKGLVPVPGLLAFLMRNRLTFTCFFVGFSLNAVVGMGTVAWLPTFFVRTHGWAPHEVGYAYGAIVSIVGLTGVLIGPRVAEWLVARGMKDSLIRFPMLCLLFGAVPSALSFMVSDPYMALGLIALKQFIFTLPMATMAAALQLITPNRFRGQISALYLFVGNVLAVATGPVIVALLTDFLFQDESKLGLSIILMILTLIPLGALLLWIGIRPFRQSLADAEREIALGAEPAPTETLAANKEALDV